MISKNNLPQSRPNWTNKSVFLSSNSYQATDLIPTTKQLSLFDSTPRLQPLLSSHETESDKPYPLQIGYIPDSKRTAADRFCKLIHYESNLNIPGQYTHREAKEILRVTRDWDWDEGSLGRPKCLERLQSLLEKIGERDFQVGGAADA